MARGGFLGRIGRAIRNIVAPSPPPREREREYLPPPPPGGGPPITTADYRRVWRHEHGKGSYRKNLDVFTRLMDDVRMPESEREELWESFIQNINRGQGRYRRNSTFNQFWQDTGIDPAAMDWAKWRIAMGYTGKRRSRS